MHWTNSRGFLILDFLGGLPQLRWKTCWTSGGWCLCARTSSSYREEWFARSNSVCQASRFSILLNSSRSLSTFDTSKSSRSTIPWVSDGATGYVLLPLVSSSLSQVAHLRSTLSQTALHRPRLLNPQINRTRQPLLLPHSPPHPHGRQQLPGVRRHLPQHPSSTPSRRGTRRRTRRTLEPHLRTQRRQTQPSTGSTRAGHGRRMERQSIRSRNQDRRPGRPILRLRGRERGGFVEAARQGRSRRIRTRTDGDGGFSLLELLGDWFGSGCEAEGVSCGGGESGFDEGRVRSWEVRREVSFSLRRSRCYNDSKLTGTLPLHLLGPLSVDAGPDSLEVFLRFVSSTLRPTSRRVADLLSSAFSLLLRRTGSPSDDTETRILLRYLNELDWDCDGRSRKFLRREERRGWSWIRFVSLCTPRRFSLAFSFGYVFSKRCLSYST